MTKYSKSVYNANNSNISDHVKPMPYGNFDYSNIEVVQKYSDIPLNG